jgi:hypothetical protein
MLHLLGTQLIVSALAERSGASHSPMPEKIVAPASLPVSSLLANRFQTGTAPLFPLLFSTTLLVLPRRTWQAFFAPFSSQFMHRTRYPERRRTVRITLQIPLKVRCQMPEGEAIDLRASTQFVSGHGALIVMDAPLLPGQKVELFNEMTSESVDCIVTSVREKNERRLVGLGFASPKQDFWHVVFPKAGTRQAIRSSQTGSLVPPGSRPNLPSRS